MESMWRQRKQISKNKIDDRRTDNELIDALFYGAFCHWRQKNKKNEKVLNDSFDEWGFTSEF